MSRRLLRLVPTLSMIAVAMALPPATASTSGARFAPRGPTAGPTPRAIALNRVPRYVSVGERAALLALRVAGTPYRWGGESPESGFDCSGLVRWAYGTAWSGLAAQLVSPLEHRGAGRSLADPGWRRPRLPRSGPCRPLRRQRPHGSLAVLSESPSRSSASRARTTGRAVASEFGV